MQNSCLIYVQIPFIASYAIVAHCTIVEYNGWTNFKKHSVLRFKKTIVVLKGEILILKLIFNVKVNFMLNYVSFTIHNWYSKRDQEYKRASENNRFYLFSWGLCHVQKQDYPKLHLQFGEKYLLPEAPL